MGRKTLQDTTNLTEGPITRALVLFALPFFGSSLIQQLYNTVDLMFVGRLLGKDASAAVGAGSLLITCMLGLFTGLSVGVGVVTANAFGSGDLQKVKRVIHTAASITLLGGGAMMALSIALTPTFLRWLRVPESIFPLAVTYIRIYFLSLLSIIAYNMSAGILRALGNSRTPMLYQFFGGLANVLGNTLFIYVLRWGVRGAAAATFLSQGVAALLTVRKVCRLDERYRLRFREIAPEPALVRDIFAVGLPAAVQSMVITFSNLIIQSRINGLGVDSIAAFTAYFKVENFVYLPILSFGQANTTFCGQNTGAGRPERARKGTRVALVLGVAITVAISAALLIFHDFAFGLFTNDASVVELGASIARITFPFYFLYVFLEVLSSAIRGAGKSLPPMVIILLNSCVLRVAILQLIMTVNPSVQGVALVYPITWAGNVLCLSLYYFLGHWMPVQKVAG